MSAFTNILVPYDGSGSAQRALDAAVGIASESAVITLLHIAPDPIAADPTTAVAERMAGVVRNEADTEKEIATYWDNLKSMLNDVAVTTKACTEKSVEIKSEVKTGVPATIITEYAEKNGIDIIVMGRRGLGAVRAMFGSVSQRVAHETDLPILLVK